jgi:DNA-binding response OmpR family regulator
VEAVRFGGFELNLTAHVLLRAGKEVELTSKEYGVLSYFAARIGRALIREEILNTVWGNSLTVTPRSVERCITTSRAKIEANPREPVFILTIRDVGYRFEVGPRPPKDSIQIGYRGNKGVKAVL